MQLDILNFGGWNFNGPGFEPTGEPLFATGAGSNAGSYSDPQMDSLINQTHTSSSLSVFPAVRDVHRAAAPPLSGFPDAYKVKAMSSKLANVSFNPLADILPEYWNFTK